MSDTVIAGLTSFWLGTSELNLAELERYYYGDQTVTDNGMLTTAQMQDPDVERFFKPTNFTAVVVDEPIDYLASGRPRITAGGSERVEAWAADYYQRRIARKLADAVRWQGLYGTCYAYLWTDREGASRGLKVDVIPPIEGGSPRALADFGGQDEEELTAAVLFKRVPVDSKKGFEEYRITVTRERVVVERRLLSASERGGAANPATQRWEPVSDTPNPSGVLPVVPIFNPTPSDVLHFLRVQDDLDKLRLDWRAAREYHGFPLLTSTAEVGEGVTVGAGRIIGGGDIRRVDPADLSSFQAERESLLEDGAKITKSLALLAQQGGNLSGVALKFLQQSFLGRLHGKAVLLAAALEQALTVAARILAVDTELYALETRRVPEPPTPQDLAAAEFAVEFEPNVPADEEAQARIAQIWDSLGMSAETVFGKAGVENPGEEVERAEVERAAAVERARAAGFVPPGANPEPEPTPPS